MARPLPPEPSPSEWKVLRVVWELGRCNARDVSARLLASEGWAPTTVKTLLARLVEKGHLAARRRGARLEYSAASPNSPRRALLQAADELLGRAREDSVGPLLAHLVKQSELSSAELAELRQLVEAEERRRAK